MIALDMLKDKTTLVTGGSRGIGRAAVLMLAEAGARVAVNYQTSCEAAKEVCAEVRGLGGYSRVYQADVSHDEQAEEMVERVVQDFGPIDILVNNAGIARDKSFLKMSQPMWDEVLNVNLNGPVNVTRKVLPGMVAAGWGRIINVSSIVGQTGNFGQTNYSAAKGALIAFTKTLAREVARKGVTVNAVAPGFIATDMTRDMPKEGLDVVKAQTPVGRLGTPEEVAAAILFLAWPSSSYITGQVLGVNGGMYM
jgi:3-oxoacyl-(acyl-carrier-protein) reductase